MYALTKDVRETTRSSASFGNPDRFAAGGERLPVVVRYTCITDGTWCGCCKGVLQCVLLHRYNLRIIPDCLVYRTQPI